MKILRLSTFLDYGGLETRLANISYIHDSNEWVFVCLNRAGHAADIIKNNNKKIINLHAKPSIYSLSTFLKVYKCIQKENPDVIHTSGAEANFHGILAAKLLNVPRIIGEEIGIPKHRRKARFIFSKLYALTDFVIGNSDVVLEAVHKLEKVPLEKLIKIDNPIIFKDLSAYKKQEKSNARFDIIMISRLEPVKNIEAVIRVISKLLKDQIPVHLSMAGTGSHQEKLISEVQKHNLENSISFLGHVPDPYPHLIQADLFVLNSLTEGFSNALVEAMYSKTLSLSTATGAASDIIQDKENGFLIPPNDEVALLEKLKFIISLSKETRLSMAEKGQQNIMNNFSLEKHRKELMKCYNP